MIAVLLVLNKCVYLYCFLILFMCIGALPACVYLYACSALEDQKWGPELPELDCRKL